jgi:hypothetical protein
LVWLLREPMMRKFSLPFAALCATLLAASVTTRADAQDVRGTVRDSASGQPVRGAVVIVQDARGATLARNLTGERGQYLVRLSDNARRVQVLRIGFRPRTLDLPSRVNGSVQLDVALATLPTLLQGLRVTANARCSPRSDRADALALLDQARAGLLTLVVAREANPARMTRLAFTRTLDLTGTRTVQQRVRIDSAVDQSVSFQAVRTAREFVQDGFRLKAGGQQTVYAPDADILLDDDFARGYCFQIAKPADNRPNQIGLAFVPASRRKGRVDIDGALWIDTLSRALVDIEFRHRGVEPQAEDLGAGGYIGFRDMPNGVTLIDRWWLRAISSTDTLPDWKSRTAVQQPYEINEIGGELARARWNDGTSWVSPLGTLQLGLALPAGGRAAGVGVGLENTDYRAISDSTGHATFVDLIPGPYKIFVVDPVLAPIGVVLPTGVTYEAKRATTDVVSLSVPTAQSFLSELCGYAALPIRGAFVMARAVNSNDTPAANVNWRIRRLGTKGWSVVASGRTGESGLFQRCSTALTQRERIEVAVWRDGGAEERVVRELRDVVTAFPLVVPSIVATRAAGAMDTQNSGVLAGIVSDSITGLVVPDARISLVGTLFETVADSSGRFLLAGIPRGDHTVEVSSPWLDSLGAVKRVNLSVRSDTAPIDLHVPSLSQIASATCGTPDVAGAVVGRVTMRGASDALEGIAVVAEWSEPGTHAAGAPAGGAAGNSDRTRWIRTVTDARGTFRLCGVPVNVALRVSTDPDSAMRAGAAPISVEVPSARRFARADLTLDRTVLTGAVFTGKIVADGSNDPIANVEVLFPDFARSVLTDEQGAFRIRDIPPGTHTILVRALGYSPVTAQVEFAANKAVDHSIALARVQALATVDVNAINIPSTTFEDHRKLGLGRFITPEAMERSKGRQLGPIIADQMGGSGVIPGRSGGSWPVGKRAPSHILGRGACAGGGAAPNAPKGAGSPCSFDENELRGQGYYCPTQGEKMRGLICACYTQVYLDDRLQNPGSPTEPFDLSSIPTTSVEAVEIYKSPAETPSKYNSLNAKCGVILLWTRRERDFGLVTVRSQRAMPYTTLNEGQ